MPAITAEVVIEWPSVSVCHGSTKNRRLAGSSVESGTFRERDFRREGRSERSSEGHILPAAEGSQSEPNLPPHYKLTLGMCQLDS